MLKFLCTVAVGAVLIPGSEARAATPIQIPLREQNGSGERGTATLLQATNGGVIVRLRLSGAPEGVAQPAHIHTGTCDKLDPKPAYPLNNAVNGLSEKKIDDISLADLIGGTYAINVHKSTKEVSVYVACGNITAK